MWTRASARGHMHGYTVENSVVVLGFTIGQGGVKNVQKLSTWFVDVLGPRMLFMVAKSPCRYIHVQNR